jgi:DegV family protein with EDD domain
MSPHVAVVTDSTSYLPPGLSTEAGITVVPLHVAIGDMEGEEGTSITPHEVASALGARGPRVTTSRPTPAAFSDAYRSAFSAGATAIVSLHLSSRLSGTYESALLAAATVEGEVRVLDSQSIGMGLGFAVLAAAEAARAGAPPGEVERVARRSWERTTVLFYVDTLEHLRRGGRVRAATAWVGTALAVKPLLHMVDGEIVVREKVRTSARALARLEAWAVAEAGESGCDLAVHHLGAPERAEFLAGRIAERLRRVGRVVVSEVGAVVGAHAGPGMVGAVVHRW